MAVDLVVPSPGESITEVQIARWLKKPGDWVAKDEPVVEIDSDKATFEIPAPVAGVLVDAVKENGAVANVGDIIGHLEAQEAPSAPSAPAASRAEPPAKPAEAPEAAAKPAESRADAERHVMPAAQRLLEQHGLRPEVIEASGPGGRILKEDVERHLAEAAPPPPAPAPARPAPLAPKPTEAPAEVGYRGTEAVPMSPMRRRIADRLVTAQQTAAMLTTFNEIDMSAVMELRKQYQDDFTKRYSIKLGFMSFFVKAAVDALKRCPELNARIEGTDIVYHHYYDVGIAVSGKKGLAVPVIRNAERLSFAEVELKIADFGARARDGKLELEELAGGTFTITNGGVFGSLLSTPIINPPQSGILGMHAINDRPMAVNGQVVIRPMMYVALTYDHRIVDGREAVTFLRRIKEAVESPTRMLLEV